MIWLTWRQHRLQMLFGAAVLVLLAVFMLPSGFGIDSTFRGSGLAQCLAIPGRDCHALESLFSHRYTGLQFTIPLFLILPALIGVFWGAPLVAREVEQGTHRLAWTQGISRLRWAGTKVIVLAGVTVVGAALLSMLVSWWSRSFVAASDDRLSPGVFDLRGVVPIAYALFALAVGVAAGTLIRRTIPAMVASLGTYAGVRLAVDLLFRSHFASPRTVSYSFFGPYPGPGLATGSCRRRRSTDLGISLRTARPSTSTCWGRGARGSSPHRGRSPAKARCKRVSNASDCTSSRCISLGPATGPSRVSRPPSSPFWPSACSGSASGGCEAASHEDVHTWDGIWSFDFLIEEFKRTQEPSRTCRAEWASWLLYRPAGPPGSPGHCSSSASRRSRSPGECPHSVR